MKQNILIFTPKLLLKYFKELIPFLGQLPNNSIKTPKNNSLPVKEVAKYFMIPPLEIILKTHYISVLPDHDSSNLLLYWKTLDELTRWQ